MKNFYAIDHLVCFPSDSDPANAKDCMLWDANNREVELLTALSAMNLDNIEYIAQVGSKFTFQFDRLAACKYTERNAGLTKSLRCGAMKNR